MVMLQMCAAVWPMPDRHELMVMKAVLMMVVRIAMMLVHDCDDEDDSNVDDCSDDNNV